MDDKIYEVLIGFENYIRSQKTLHRYSHQETEDKIKELIREAVVEELKDLIKQYGDNTFEVPTGAYEINHETTKVRAIPTKVVDKRIAQLQDPRPTEPYRKSPRRHSPNPPTAQDGGHNGG